MSIEITVDSVQPFEHTSIVVDGLTTVMGPNNGGKALRHGSLVSTPKGWRKIEDLSVGDAVFAGDGSPTVVCGVFPQGIRPTWRVDFEDGRNLTVDSDHLWQVSIGDRRFHYGEGPQQWELLTTAQIMCRVGSIPTKFNRPAIPVAGPVLYEPQSVPLDPYLLGVLLGDGCIRTHSVGLSSMDLDILDGVRKVLPSSTTVRKIGKSKCDYRIRVDRGQKNPILDSLRELNLIRHSWDKFVPVVYKHNSVAIRLAVLQGLMDTDGWVLAKSNSIGFSSCSQQLTDDVAEIVQSLGGTVRRRTKSTSYTHKGQKLAGRTAHVLRIRLPMFDVFRLPRKLSSVKPLIRRVNPLMVAFTSAGEAECTCIRVDHPSGLFQVQGHLVTHNSSLCRAIKACVANGSGTSLVRNGCDAATVTITSGDQTLQWSKSHKGKSSYRINGEDPIFPGRELPDEVKDFGIRPLYLTGETLWPQISSQFNELYLIDKPGSLLGEAISDVNKVSRLNGALKLSEAAWRLAAAEVTQCQKELDAVGLKLDVLSGLSSVTAEREGLASEHNLLLKQETAAEQLAQKSVRRKKLVVTVDTLKSVNGLKLSEVDLAKQAEGIAKIRKLHQKRLTRLRELETLETLPDEVEASDVSIQPLIDLVALKARRDASQRSLVELPSQLEEVCIDFKLVQSLIEIQSKRLKGQSTLTASQDKMSTVQQRVLELDELLKQKQQMLHELEHQVNQDKGICAACNRPL